MQGRPISLAPGRLTEQPCPGVSPIAVDSSGRHAQGRHRLLDRHAGEVTELDDLRLADMLALQFRQGGVECEDTAFSPDGPTFFVGSIISRLLVHFFHNHKLTKRPI